MLFRSLAALGTALLIAAVIAVVAHAQPEPMKWGDVPDEHLSMVEYAADPDAQAVILGDYGRAVVNSNWDIEFERHRRIKLLSEAAYDLADVTIWFDANDGFQQVRRVQGQTFVREPNGRVRRVKLDKRSIFTEDLEGGRKRIKFTLPALAPGAVVEFRYTMKTESPLQVPRWYFQDEEPVLWSEFRLEHPQSLAYTYVLQGFPDFVVEEEKEGLRPDGRTRNYRWATADVPALREERYMTTLDDYTQKLDVQLVEYYRSGIGTVQVLKSWEQLAEELANHAGFGRKLNAGRAVQERAQALTAGVTGSEARARALYDFVRGSIVWDGRHRAFADRELRDVLDTRRGSSAETNLLLVALMKATGLDAAPALVSTRSHGRVLRTYPLVSQFNYVIAAVKLNGRWQLLDATDPLRPMGLLPVEALNEQVWLVSDRPEWLEVSPRRSEHHLRVQARLQPDGTLTGVVRSEKAGYSGLRARHHVRDLGAEGYVRDHLVNDVAGVEVGEVIVTGQEQADSTLVAEVAFSVPGYGQAVGNLLLINPLLMMRTGENPFKSERRSYPVDFAYPFETTYEAEIVVPEGFVVDEIPGNALFLLPVRSGGYERTVEEVEGGLRVAATMRIMRPLFAPNLYRDLQSFFEKARGADEATVVLARAPMSPSSPSVSDGSEDEVGGDGIAPADGAGGEQR